MDYQNNGYELDWDAEIENEGQKFIVAEPGDYDFVVTGFERARFAGSGKMPPCKQAKLTIRLEIPGAAGECIVKHNLFLHSKTEWKLCEFFTAIGLRKKGQKVSMNWNAVTGARGRCKVSKHSWQKDGNEYWANDIDKFYAPEDGDLPFTLGQAAPQGNPAAPQGYPAAGAAPSWQGGKF